MVPQNIVLCVPDAHSAFSNNVTNVISHQPQPDVPHFQKKKLCLRFSQFNCIFTLSQTWHVSVQCRSSEVAWWQLQGWQFLLLPPRMMMMMMVMMTMMMIMICSHSGVCICISHLELCLVHIQILNLPTIWLCPALHLRIMMVLMMVVLMAVTTTSPRNSSSFFSSCSAVTFPSSAYSPILFAGRAHTGDPFRYRLGSCK